MTSMADPAGSRGVTSARAVQGLGLAYLAAYAVATLNPNADPDMFHGLALARELLRTGHLPVHDVFAYTPTQPVVVHHEWLAFTLLYAMVERLGAVGLTLVGLTLQSGVIAAALLLARWQGARLPILCLLAPLGLTLLAPGLTMLRAQTWSLVCTAGVLACLELDRRGRRWWIAPFLAMHVLWLNMHGGFVIGLGLLGVHLVEQALSRRPIGHLLATIVVACALTVVNPYGIAYIAYLWDALRLDRSAISEWQPLGEGYPFALVAWTVSVLVAVYGAARKGLARSPGLLLLAVAALLALRHQRHVSVYAVVWLAQVPPLVNGTPLSALIERWWTTWPRTVAAVLAIGLAWAGSRAIASAPWRLELPTGPGAWIVAFPAGAADYLRDSRFEGNLMTPFELGAFVSWKLHPRVKVSLDGRYEVAYPMRVFDDHVVFYRAQPGWQEVRDRYPTHAVLVPAEAPIAPVLRAEGLWPLVYEDDMYLVFMRPERAVGLSRVARRGQTPAGSFP